MPCYKTRMLILYYLKNTTRLGILYLTKKYRKLIAYNNAN